MLSSIDESMAKLCIESLQKQLKDGPKNQGYGMPGLAELNFKTTIESKINNIKKLMFSKERQEFNIDNFCGDLSDKSKKLKKAQNNKILQKIDRLTRPSYMKKSGGAAKKRSSAAKRSAKKRSSAAKRSVKKSAAKRSSVAKRSVKKSAAKRSVKKRSSAAKRSAKKRSSAAKRSAKKRSSAAKRSVKKSAAKKSAAKRSA